MFAWKEPSGEGEEVDVEVKVGEPEGTDFVLTSPPASGQALFEDQELPGTITLFEAKRPRRFDLGLFGWQEGTQKQAHQQGYQVRFRIQDLVDLLKGK